MGVILLNINLSNKSTFQVGNLANKASQIYYNWGATVCTAFIVIQSLVDC